MADKKDDNGWRCRCCDVSHSRGYDDDVIVRPADGYCDRCKAHFKLLGIYRKAQRMALDEQREETKTFVQAAVAELQRKQKDIEDIVRSLSQPKSEGEGT